MDAEQLLPGMAYVFDGFPVPSETFISREVQQLLKDGLRIQLFALHRPTWMHPEFAPLAESTHYLSQTRLPAQLQSLLQACRSVAFLRLFLCLLGESLLPADRPESRPGAIERVRDLYHLFRMAAVGSCIAGKLNGSGVRHIHCHFSGAPALAGRFAAARLQISYSVSVHGSDFARRIPFAIGNVRRAAFVLTCTARNRDALTGKLALSPRHVHLVYHGLDLTRYSPGSRRPPTQHSILSIGRLVPKKGMDLLIAACGELKRRRVTFRCEILGEGPERATLEQQIGACGLSEQVTLRGQCTQDDVRESLSRASLFVLACRKDAAGDEDGLPNAVVEAMAAGVPVVCGDAGAVGELVEHEIAGILVPPDDAHQLAEALVRVMHEPSAAAGRAAEGRRRVERDFDLKTNRVLEVFQQELCRPSVPG